MVYQEIKLLVYLGKDRNVRIFLKVKYLSKIILLGEKLDNPSILQFNLGLSEFKVLLEIKIESFLYLNKCEILSEYLFVILNLFFE